MAIKLNLGCYGKKFPDFINIDIRPEAEPDVVDNAFTLETLEDFKGKVNLIYSSHMLEHLSFVDARKALERWFDLLAEGGVLRLAVPDMEAVFAHYFYWKNMKELKSALWGSQRHEFDFHKCGWTQESLTEELIDVGFTNVKKWEPHLTQPHAYIDDYSQSYYPHGSKTVALANGKIIDSGGKLMSLNLEAVK